MATKEEILKSDWFKNSGSNEKSAKNDQQRVKKRAIIDQKIMDKRQAIKYLNAIAGKKSDNPSSAGR